MNAQNLQWYETLNDGSCLLVRAIHPSEDWQGIGLGVCLMRHLIQFAREQGICKMVSMDLAENHEMRVLAHFLGFKSRQDPDDPRMVVHELALD